MISRSLVRASGAPHTRAGVVAIALGLACALATTPAVALEQEVEATDPLAQEQPVEAATESVAQEAPEAQQGEAALAQVDYVNGAVTTTQVTDPLTGQVTQVTTQTAEFDAAAAAATAAEQAPLLAQATEPVLLEARAAAILDKAGNVLFERNGDEELSPASVTKVMTAVVALDSLERGVSLDDVVTVTEPYLGPLAQMADFTDGEQLTLRELMRVMLVYSANDAAYNVALHVGGSIEGFADLMNAKAAEIGMTHSHFMNPHGIDEDGHYASALDLARLSRYAMQNYPFIAQTVCNEGTEIPLHGTASYFHSTDALLGHYAGIRGVKTGYAEAFTFMGASGRGDVSLYTAVLGCVTNAGRFNDTAALMDWAYAKYYERQVSEDSWIVSLHPYALDLGYRTVLSSATDAQGTLWPDGGSVAYASAVIRPDRLLGAGEGYGWTRWTQAARQVGTSLYATREVPVRVSAWPTFSLPLFEDVATLGRSATDA